MGDIDTIKQMIAFIHLENMTALDFMAKYSLVRPEDIAKFEELRNSLDIQFLAVASGDQKVFGAEGDEEK